MGDPDLARRYSGINKSAPHYTDEALDKPVVGILSTASDFNPCHATAGQLAEKIADGVRVRERRRGRGS